jgi:hypothetical protein
MGATVQLSLDPMRDPVCLQITVRHDAITDKTLLQLLVLNRHNDVLGSLGKVMSGDEEVELIPQCLHLAALNWIFSDTRAILRDVQDVIQSHRKAAKAAQP